MKQEFYEDEVREGFYVPSMIKKAWGAQMDVLNETDIICRRHNIPYFADWGTLLATIRHSGYIPWDDDLDISMRRKDYERFLKYAEEELPEGFKVMHFKNHPGHHFFVARIVGKPRICFEEDHLKRFHGFPYIAGIDLFVLDNACTDRKKEKLKSKMAEFVLTVADNIADGATTGNEAKELLKQCEDYTGKKIDKSLSGEDLRIAMYTIVESIFASIPDEESDALVQMMPFGMYDRGLYIPKEYYRDTVRLPYMDTTMPVPLCYDAVMRQKFGNYMQIRKNFGGHDYPFFYGQHRDFVSVLDFEYPAYKATKADIVSPRPKEPSDEKSCDVVFMPFAAKYWKYMEPLYRHYMDDPGYDVYVVPIPYYYKTWDGSAGEEVFDPGAYPEDVEILDYRIVDLPATHPAKIIIQNPFDEWNTVMTVHPGLYSANLRPICEELVYVPFFVTDDFTKESEKNYINMDSYVCMPGVINADRLILPSDTLKETYIEKLMEFTDSVGDEEVRAALDRKIEVSPQFVYERGKPVDKEESAVNNPADSKKRIIFFTTISMLAENEISAIDKINSVIDTFNENRDRIEVTWISQCCSDLSVVGKNTAEGYKKALSRFKELGLGSCIKDLPTSENRAYALSHDAYYGDPSSLALEFFYEHKPVMIQNPKI